MFYVVAAMMLLMYVRSSTGLLSLISVDNGGAFEARHYAADADALDMLKMSENTGVSFLTLSRGRRCLALRPRVAELPERCHSVIKFCDEK